MLHADVRNNAANGSGNDRSGNDRSSGGEGGALLLTMKPYSMTDVDKKGLEEFVSTGRTGRRNALPDILDKKTSDTEASVAGLPQELDKLRCTDDNEEGKSSTASANCDDKAANDGGGDKSKIKDSNDTTTTSKQNDKITSS